MEKIYLIINKIQWFYSTYFNSWILNSPNNQEKFLISQLNLQIIQL